MLKLGRNLTLGLATTLLFSSGSLLSQTKLIGTGTLNGGSIFSLNLDGSEAEKLIDFTAPLSPKNYHIVEIDGFLWWTSDNSIVKSSLDGQDMEVVHTLTSAEGTYLAGQLTLSNGRIWGTAYAGGNSNAGSIFSILPDGTDFTVNHLFDITGSYNPDAGLIEFSNRLWGTTLHELSSDNGSLYSLDLNGGDFTIHYQFSYETGAQPHEELIIHDNKLWGVTYSGGEFESGVIFNFDPNNSEYMLVHSLQGIPSSALLLLDEVFYGTTQSGGTNGVGALFAIDGDGANFNILHDFNWETGAFPTGDLVKWNDQLVGAALISQNSYGVLYSFDLALGEYAGTYSFNGEEGIFPSNGLTLIDNIVIGATYEGGMSNMGTLYTYGLETATFETLQHFGNPQGNTPAGPLTEAYGKLWGVTQWGGQNGTGTIFSMEKDGTHFTVIHEFEGESGQYLTGGVVILNDKIWGTTNKSVYTINPDGSDFLAVKHFEYTYGLPNGGLCIFDGKLWGIAEAHGSFQDASIFSINPETRAFNTEYTFESDGSLMGALLPVNNQLWGSISDGNSGGAIFNFNPSNSTFQITHTFNGGTPTGYLLENDGEIWGMTRDSYPYRGAVFSVSVATGELIHEETIIMEATPVGGLTKWDDSLYGMSMSGGEHSNGWVFSFDVETSEIEKVLDLSSSFGALPIATSSITIVTIKEEQEIYFEIEEKTYGDEPIEMAAQSSSGLSVIITSSNPDVAIGQGSTILIKGAGQATLTANQYGNDSYHSATSVVRQLTVHQASIQVTANAWEKTYGDEDPELTYLVTEGELFGTDEITGSLSRATGENVGTYFIKQNTLTASGNYALTYVGNDLAISERPITITAASKSKTYGDNDPALTFEITEGNLIGPDELTGALTRESGENVGQYAITQNTLTAGDNYDISFEAADLEISERPITITAASKSKTYGDNDPALTFEITEGNLIGPDEISGVLSRESGENAGNYDIIQNTLSVSANYDLSYVGDVLEITTRPLGITADLKTKTYGNSDPALTYQISSGTLVGIDALSGSLSREAGENVGEYGITQNTLSAGSNYDLSFNSNDLEIIERPLAITADAKSKVYGDADPTLTYQITEGNLVGSDALSGSLIREAGENVGSYSISQNSVSAGSNYAISYTGNNLTIDQATLVATADDKTKVYGQPNPSFNISYEGFVNGDDAGDITAPSISTSADASSSTGEYTIALSGGSAANYALELSNGTLTITKASLMATANDVTIDQGDALPTFTLSYTGFVNGDDAGDLDNPPVASVTITDTDTFGEFTISVSEGSDNNYLISSVNGLLVITEVLGLKPGIDVNVYPNPTSNVLKIESNEPMAVAVYDLKGSLVLATKNANEIPVSGLSAGTYLIRLTNQKGETVTLKFVKN